MRKDRNKPASFPEKGMELSKADILRGRNNFKRLFEGAVTVYSEKHISLRFYTFFAERYECKMGFIVAKRLGNAAKRNYIKRIFRESYRLHKHAFASNFYTVLKGFHGAFLAKRIRMDFQTAEKEIISLLDRVVDNLHATPDL